MRALYDEGHGLRDISLRFGCERETVRYHLRKAGTKIRPRGCHSAIARDKQTGKNHHNWKGGRCHSHGYWLLMAPGHPHASRYGYVPEHRIVVEGHLAMTDPCHPALDESGVLRTDWVVHHKNGNKGDNRIENLEPLPRNKHHSWMHYRDEMERLKSILAQHGIEH